ncbi:MAG: hydrogenase accessory protein HypB, partial [Methanothermobacter sp.]
AVGADLDKMVEDVKRINPDVKVLKTSLKTGEGVQEIIDAIEEAMAD